MKQRDRLTLDQQLCFPLYAAAREVTRLYTPHLKKLNLTYPQYLVLLALFEYEQLTVSELSSLLYLDSGTLTPMLKTMEAHGRITRTRSAEDERVVVIALTAEGKKLKEKLKKLPETIGSCIPLNNEEAKTLYRLLYKVLAGPEED